MLVLYQSALTAVKRDHFPATSSAKIAETGHAGRKHPSRCIRPVQRSCSKVSKLASSFLGWMPPGNIHARRVLGADARFSDHMTITESPLRWAFRI